MHTEIFYSCEPEGEKNPSQTFSFGVENPLHQQNFMYACV